MGDHPRVLDRPIIIGVCPRCAGTSVEHVDQEGNQFRCTACDGLGDLDAFRLQAAYDAGVEEGIRRMTQVAEMMDVALNALRSRPEPSIEQIRNRVTVRYAEEVDGT